MPMSKPELRKRITRALDHAEVPNYLFSVKASRLGIVVSVILPGGVYIKEFSIHTNDSLLRNDIHALTSTILMSRSGNG